MLVAVMPLWDLAKGVSMVWRRNFIDKLIIQFHIFNAKNRVAKLAKTNATINRSLKIIFRESPVLLGFNRLQHYIV